MKLKFLFSRTNNKPYKMKKLIPQFFFSLLAISTVFANPNEVSCINEAAIVAKVNSYTQLGYLNCEFQCFLDMNYVSYEQEPEIYFQIGTKEEPTLFKNLKIEKLVLDSLKVDYFFSDENYKLKINFGQTKVKGEFVARLFIIEQGIEKVIILKPTNFDDKITQIKTAEPENGLCKADLFLKKIDFEHLYDNISLHTF